MDKSDWYNITYIILYSFTAVTLWKLCAELQAVADLVGNMAVSPTVNISRFCLHYG